ncbi:MAG: YdgA family protein [Gammaproteobacteria bacterium]|nr:YdgA family protein [Gammaproteobacteria bacterium]
MKKFLLFFFILAAALLLVPGVIGYQVEAQYSQLIDQLDREGFTVEEQHYSRRWFSADAETRLLLKSSTGPAEAEEPVRFTLRSHLSHGPLLPSSAPGLAEIATQILIDGKVLFDHQEQAPVTTFISFNRAGEMTLDLSPVDIEPTADRPAIKFYGLTGSVIFEPDFTKSKTRLKMPGLEIKGDGAEQATISGLTLDMHSSEGVAGLMMGDGTFRLESFDINSDEVDINMNGISVDVGTTANGEMVQATAAYRFQVIEVEDQSFGPVELLLKLDNLSAPTLVKIQKAMQELNAQQLSENQRGMAVMSTLMAIIPELLVNDPLFALERVRFETQEGAIDGHFSIQSKGLGWPIKGGQQELLEKLLSEASLRMPESYFQDMLERYAADQFSQEITRRQLAGEEIQLPDEAKLNQIFRQQGQEQLDLLLQQEILQRDGRDLVFDMILADGLLTVNGKTVPLPAMFQ